MLCDICKSEVFMEMGACSLVMEGKMVWYHTECMELKGSALEKHMVKSVMGTVDFRIGDYE